MELTYNQIRSITTGTVYIEETETGLAFHRFSQKQEEFFFEKHSYFPEEFFTTQFGAGYFGLIAKTTAGVTFDFYTDAVKVCVKIAELNIPVDTKKQHFDVYVNGKRKATCVADENFEVKLQTGKKRVTVYFPWGNYPIISGVTLEQATYFKPAGGKVEVLCIGDSITHGGNAFHPAGTWVTVMARKLGVTVINQGVCGYVNDKDVVETVCEPKVVITAYGVNDYHRKTKEQIKDDTDAFIKEVQKRYPKSVICSILPIWTAWNSDPNWFEDKRAALREVYENNGVQIIDGLKMIPHDTKYLDDGVVHPNDAGFVYYGNRVARFIKNFL